MPTLHDLTEELAAWKGEGHLHSYKKTSLKPYIETFEKFLENLNQGSTTLVSKEVKTETASTNHSDQLKMAVEAI